MIEAVCDAVQLVVLAACLGLSLWRAFATRDTVWLMLACFFGCMLLGNVNWLGYQVVFGETPKVALIEDLRWTAGLLFLALVGKLCDDARAPSPPVPAAWIPVVACAACCVFFIVSKGEPLLNVAEPWMRWAFAAAALVVLAVRVAQAVRLGDCDNLRIKRLYRINIVSALMFCASAVMFWNMGQTEWSTNWVAFLMAGDIAWKFSSVSI